MTEAKAARLADKMSRETGKPCKVIHMGSNRYVAVIVGGSRHIASASHN